MRMVDWLGAGGRGGRKLEPMRPMASSLSVASTIFHRSHRPSSFSSERMLTSWNSPHRQARRKLTRKGRPFNMDLRGRPHPTPGPSASSPGDAIAPYKASSTTSDGSAGSRNQCAGCGGGSAPEKGATMREQQLAEGGGLGEQAARRSYGRRE